MAECRWWFAPSSLASLGKEVKLDAGTPMMIRAQYT